MMGIVQNSEFGIQNWRFFHLKLKSIYKKTGIVVTLILASFIGFSQQPFSGVFEYTASISLPDTNVILKKWDIKVFTNDTLVRVETETNQFGNQVYIRHLTLNKAYLLLQLEDKKYAIQTNLDKPKNDTVQPKYTYKKQRGTKRIAGVKCKKYTITDKGQSEGFTCYFAKKISNKYLEVYPEIKGLATDYYIPTADGLVRYELTRIIITDNKRDLFGVPTDYQKITFDEFVRMFSEQ